MEIKQADWDRWKVDPVTREWFGLFLERQNENLIPALIAQAEKDIAAAEAAEPGQQLDMYKAHTDNIIQTVKLEQAERKEKMQAQKEKQQGAASGNKAG